MTMLADQVDVVIGIDTHKHTHTAAVVTAVTGAALETVTVPTDVPVTSSSSSSRTVIPGRGCGRSRGPARYGAGLTRFLARSAASRCSSSIDRSVPRVATAPRRTRSTRCVLPATRWRCEHNAAPREQR